MKKSLSKLLTLALALTMALSLTACGGGDKPAENPDNTNTIASSDDNSTEAPDNSEEPVTSTPAESEPVETPEQPEEPEVPSEIEVVAGETYSIEGGLDISFGEITYGDIYMMDGIATQSTFGFELPVTIHNVSNNTIAYENISDPYNDKWGTYVFDEKENENDYVCQINLLYTDRLSYPKQDDIIDVDAKWDTVLKTGRINRFDNIGFAEIKLMGTTFIIHYDATEFLTSNNIPID